MSWALVHCRNTPPTTLLPLISSSRAHWNAPRFQRTKLNPTRLISTAAKASRFSAAQTAMKNSPASRMVPAKVNMMIETPGDQRPNAVCRVESHHRIRLEALLLRALGAASLDHADRAENLLGVRGQVRVGFPRRQRAGPDAPGEPPAPENRDHGDRHAHQTQQGIERRDEGDRGGVGRCLCRNGYQHAHDGGHLRAVLVDPVDGIPDPDGRRGSAATTGASAPPTRASSPG